MEAHAQTAVNLQLACENLRVRKWGAGLDSGWGMGDEMGDGGGGHAHIAVELPLAPGRDTASSLERRVALEPHAARSRVDCTSTVVMLA